MQTLITYLNEPSHLAAQQRRVDEQVLGCGWFDSSHELRQGLVVREHACLDEVAPPLPLAEWLDLHNSSKLVTPAT
jgi:hypothetical protein